MFGEKSILIIFTHIYYINFRWQNKSKIKIGVAGFKVEMLICESYFLLILEKWKHKNSIALGSYEIKYLPGAGIMDLILREKLLLEGKKLRVIDTNSTGDVYLDEILAIIKDSKKIRKLNRWVERLSLYHHIQLYTLVFKSLESQGILKFEKRVFAKVFYKWSYDFTRPEVIQSLLERIQKVFSENLDPDIELLCLLSLLKNSKLIKVCIPKEYRSVAKYRIEQLVRVGNYDPIHLEMIVKTRRALRDAMREWM